MKKVLFLFITFSTVAYSQDSTAIDLENLTVTANIISNSNINSARNVSVISEKTIASAPIKTIDGILQYALNIDVRSRSSQGVQADISIRGGHYDQTLVLLDGVKMNDPQTGHHSMNLPVPLSQIEKIEVLQGGASRVFGPSAFSGVINIITKKPNNGTGVSIITGQNGLFNIDLNARIIKKGNYAGIYANAIKSDDYALNTAFKKYTLSGKIGKNLKNGFAEINLGAMGNKFHASNFYSPKYYNQYEEVAAQTATAVFHQNISNKLSSQINANFRKHNDLYDFDNYRFANKLNAVNFHQTLVSDFEWKLRSINKFGKSAFGLEYRKEKVISNRLGEPLTNKIAVKNYEAIFYDKQKIRNNTNAFFEHQKSIKSWSISGGSLLHYNSQYGFALYPGLDVSLKVKKKTNLYTSINRSLRYPTFTELYLNTASVQGDIHLKPEKALTFETGLKNHSDRSSSTISVFYRKTQDAIDRIKRPELPKPTMENIADINMFGFEFSHLWNIKSKLINSINLNYAFLKADRKENGFQSFYTLNYLRNKMTLGLNSSPIKNLNISYYYTFKNRLGNYQWDASSPILAYQPVHLMDTRLSYKYKKIKVFTDANNLLNKKYYEFGFVEQPQRWFSVGISTEF